MIEIVYLAIVTAGPSSAFGVHHQFASDAIAARIVHALFDGSTVALFVVFHDTIATRSEIFFLQ